MPVVAASHYHGMSFDQVSSVLPKDHKNWGDREFLAADPSHPNILYLTWDYGPGRTSVTFICATTGSCAFAIGDLNVVVQKSADGGLTWGHYVPINPGTVPITMGGFPASGGDSAPLFVEPRSSRNPAGRIDLLYQGYTITITSTTTYAMNPAHTYYTSSVDGGATWSAPVMVGPQDLTMSLAEWWIDGSLAVDPDGNLCATWGTQGATDIGWLSFSTDHGQTWSSLVPVTESQSPGGHIMKVAAGASCIAYVGWLSAYTPFVAPPPSLPSSPGYAQYLRPFSITRGWLSGPIRVSTQFGAVPVWPGDTFGISTLSPTKVALSWGSGVPINGQPKSQIFAANVDFQFR